MPDVVAAIGFTSAQGGLAITTGILVGVVIAILNGGLVPRKVHEEVKRDKEKIIEYQAGVIQEQATSIRNFSRSGETTNRLHETLDVRLREEVGNARSGSPSGENSSGTRI